MAEHAPAPPSVDRSADEQTPPPPAAESEDDWATVPTQAGAGIGNSARGWAALRGARTHTHTRPTHPWTPRTTLHTVHAKKCGAAAPGAGRVWRAWRACKPRATDEGRARKRVVRPSVTVRYTPGRGSCAAHHTPLHARHRATHYREN
eukprot:4895138-Prymnesium_polylepis.1